VTVTPQSSSTGPSLPCSVRRGVITYVVVSHVPALAFRVFDTIPSHLKIRPTHSGIDRQSLHSLTKSIAVLRTQDKPPGAGKYEEKRKTTCQSRLGCLHTSQNSWEAPEGMIAFASLLVTADLCGVIYRMSSVGEGGFMIWTSPQEDINSRGDRDQSSRSRLESEIKI